MVRGYYLDKHPRASVANEHYALIKMPSLKRDRVPAANVKIVKDKQTAMAEADKNKQLYPARVMGPARSSEGLNLFYILDLY